MLHHGVEDGEDVGEDGEDGGQPGDEDTVRFFVYVDVNVNGSWGFGALEDEGVEEVGIDHRFERAMITTIMTSRLARTYCRVLHATMTTKEIGSITRRIIAYSLGHPQG